MGRRRDALGGWGRRGGERRPRSGGAAADSRDDGAGYGRLRVGGGERRRGLVGHPDRSSGVPTQDGSGVQGKEWSSRVGREGAGMKSGDPASSGPVAETGRVSTTDF